MNAELTVALKLNRCCSGNHGVIPARPVRRGLPGSFPACRQAGLVLFLPVPLIAGEKQKRTTNKKTFEIQNPFLRENSSSTISL